MKANDPIFEGTTTLELWRHDDPEPDGCHVALYYRSNGEKDIYEMRVGDHVIPLHPEFPLGFPLAAHCLMHICQSLYSGELTQKLAEGMIEPTFDNLSELLDKWKMENDDDKDDDNSV